MNWLTLTFFTVFQADVDGKPLRNFRSAKIQGLLIYLALASQQAHPRDHLAALFWPDEPEKTAKRNLRLSLYRLRQLLGDLDEKNQPFLLITRTTARFNAASNYRFDVADFLAALQEEDLETAVSLYQGELLPGFSCDSLPFDDWLRQERERLHRLALDALFKLTAQSLDQADYQRAQGWARRQLELEPWREEAHRQLIQTLFLMGERSAALAQVETCRVVLAEELGAAPSRETEALAARIRQAHPAAEAPRSPQRIDQPRQTFPFVGRRPEFEVLVKVYHQASRSGLAIVTVMGKAGIGKTRLTQQFLAWATTQGADVLSGRSFETSAKLSYQPLIHLFRQRVERENAPEDLLSDLWLSQLTRLLPELRDRYPDLPPPTQEEATARQHLFEAITRLGLALAERQPLVLFIDDWHWADAASLDLLHYSAVRWAEEKTPILLLLTLRQEAVSESTDLQNWLTRLKRDIGYQTLHLSELSQPETEQMIRGFLQSESEGEREPMRQFSRWLFAETEGQPLFLTETLKAFLADGTVQQSATKTDWQDVWSKFDQPGARRQVLPEVREIVLGWLKRITPSAGALLTAASVLAQHASFAHLYQVAGLEEIAAIEALDELLSKQLLQVGHTAVTTVSHDPVYSFSHQKVSEVVYLEAGPARRRLLHRRAFDALKATTTSAAEVAHHALNAGLLAETIQFSLKAGNEAMEIFAFQVAIAHFETAWQVAEQNGWPETVSGADRQTLYKSLGRAYELINDWSKARKTYEAMIDYAQKMGSAALECVALNHLATVYITGVRDRHQVRTLLEQARALAEESGNRRGLAQTEWNLSMVALQEQETHAARHHIEKALTLARQLGHPQLLARCLNSLSYVYFQLRQWEQVEIHAGEASQLYTTVGNQVLAADSQRVMGQSQRLSGRPKESLATLEAALTFSKQIENRWGIADGARILADTWLELGDYGQAIRVGREAVRQARLMGHSGIVKGALRSWGTVQRTVMALDAARETLLEVLVKFNEDGNFGFTESWAMGELCALYAMVDAWDQAHGYAKQLIEEEGEEHLLPMALTGWYNIEALLRGGDSQLARAEVERLGNNVGNNRRYQLVLLRSQSVLAKWDGDVAQAIAHLDSALALAWQMALPGEAWPILGESGRLYAEQGEDVKAREAYGEAAGIIHRLAETIDDEGLREGFLAADVVRSILEKSEAV